MASPEAVVAGCYKAVTIARPSRPYDKALAGNKCRLSLRESRYSPGGYSQPVAKSASLKSLTGLEGKRHERTVDSCGIDGSYVELAYGPDVQTFPRAAWSSNVVVPQARSYAMGRSPALEISNVTVGVVIRDQVATTMMEIRLRNPAAARQEAELLVPVPDRAVIRGFSFQGPGAEPSARLLPRDEAKATYDRIVARARDPALLEFAGFNLVRSSVFPVEAGGTQAVRLTYEHLLPATGDRVDYVLPRSESVEYTVPWKIAVKISASGPIAAFSQASTTPKPST